MGTTLEKLSNMLETIMLEDKPEFSLVIPAYNEVGRIESTLKNLMFALDYQFSFAKNFELLIIENAICDESQAWAKTGQRGPTSPTLKPRAT